MVLLFFSLCKTRSDMLNCEKPSVDLYADNQGSIELAKNPVFHQRTKHIDVRYHYIRSQIENRNVTLKYIKSQDNIADLFTKPTNKVRLNKFNLCQ